MLRYLRVGLDSGPRRWSDLPPAAIATEMPTAFEVDSRSLLGRACDPGCNPSHHDAHTRFDQSGGRSADFDALSHDLRSTLATLALHLDTQERLTGPGAAKAALAAHTLVSEAASVRTAALRRPSIRAPQLVGVASTLSRLSARSRNFSSRSRRRILSINVNAAAPIIVLNNAQQVSGSVQPCP